MVHVRNVMHDIHILSGAELEQTYDIEIDTDGTVWDVCERISFASVQEWALFIHLQDEDVVMTSSKRRYDDE